MKTIKIIFLVLFILTGTDYFSQNTGKVYFIRSNSLGSAFLKFKVYIDEKESIELKWNRYVELNLTEGFHEIGCKGPGSFSLSYKKSKRLPLNIKTGETYFVYVNPKSWQLKVAVSQIEKKDSARLIARAKIQK